MEIQEPKILEVHVLFYSKEKFRLLDEEEKPLEQEYLLKVLGDLKDEGLKYEDLLLSALILPLFPSGLSFTSRRRPILSTLSSMSSPKG